MGQFNLSKRKGFQGSQAKHSPTSALDLYSVRWLGWGSLAFKSHIWKCWLGTQLDKGCPSVCLSHFSSYFFSWVFYTRQSEEGEITSLAPAAHLGAPVVAIRTNSCSQLHAGWHCRFTRRLFLCHAEQNHATAVHQRPSSKAPWQAPASSFLGRAGKHFSKRKGVAGQKESRHGGTVGWINGNTTQITSSPRLLHPASPDNYGTTLAAPRSQSPHWLAVPLSFP